MCSDGIEQCNLDTVLWNPIRSSTCVSTGTATAGTVACKSLLLSL